MKGVRYLSPVVNLARSAWSRSTRHMAELGAKPYVTS